MMSSCVSHSPSEAKLLVGQDAIAVYMINDLAIDNVFNYPVGKLIAINCKKNCNFIAILFLQLKHTKFGRIAIN